MVSLILNPKAGRGKAEKHLPEVLKILDVKNIKYDLYRTEYRGHATEIARKIVNQNPEKVLVLGGDGTINEVIQAFVSTNISLLPLPLGTGNDFVKYLYPRKKFDTVLKEKINSDKSIKIDLILMETQGMKRYFINGMGIGFDSEVLKNMEKIKLLKGDFLYTAAVIMTFFKFKGLKLKVTLNKIKKRLEKHFLLFNVGNGQYLGGGFRLFPRAKLTDHLMDISMVTPVGVLEFFGSLLKAFKGTHIYRKEVSYLKDSEILIESDNPLVLQVDGELIEGVKWLKLRVVPSCLKVSI
ncbi:hypothetical protein DRN58_02920 [Thermococci archaeon]|nr:MAG: hypothetical protein DRN58_02920 [Thermococci archaeon]